MTARVCVERVHHGPVVDLEEHLADLRLVLREAVLEVAADHPADDPVLVDGVGRDGERLDRLAVADDRDLVGDLLDLVELVGDHDRGDALALQALEQVEQVLGVVVVEGGGGLVEDQQLHLLRQRLGDLDQLLLADTEVLDLGERVLRETDPREELDGLPVGAVPADDAVRGRLVAEEDVLGDRQLGDQGELLVDDHDPGGLALPDVLELDDLSLEDDVAVIGPVRVDAAEHLHQRRLAGAVLPADRVDVAAVDGEADVAERLNARELLGDGAHLQDRLAHVHGSSRGRDRCPVGRSGGPSGAPAAGSHFSSSVGVVARVDEGRLHVRPWSPGPGRAGTTGRPCCRCRRSSCR